MSQSKNGDTVKVHYTGTLDDGTQFDTSKGKDPLQFTLGSGQVIPGFEEGVVGLSVGESKKINIPSDQAYGPYREDLIKTLERSSFPADLELQEGIMLQIPQDNGQAAVVQVKELTDDNVTLDANHPLAGKDLNFEIELVEITQ